MAGNPKNEIIVISDSDSESEYGEEQQEEDQQDDEEQQEKEILAAGRRKIFDVLQASLRKLFVEEQEKAKLTKLPKTPKKTNAGPSVLPTPPDSTQKLKDPLIEDDDSLPQEAEGVQYEATPPPIGNFRISRLIRNADKAGQEWRSEIVLDDPNFTVGYGDYLLRLDDDALALQGLFRNMAGQDGTVPIRMTQRVFRPWGLPSRIPLDRNGAGLPIGFSTRAARNAAEGWGIVRNEALFVGDPDTEEDVKVDVLDADRRLMSLARRSLEKNILISVES